MLLGFKLRRLLWRARRVTVDLWGAATTVGAAALVGAGWFPDLRASSADVGPIVAACALGALVVVKVAARAARAARQPSASSSPTTTAAATIKRDLELGAALVVATYVTLELSGGLALAGLPARLRARRLPRHLPSPPGRRCRSSSSPLGLEALLYAPRSTAASPSGSRAQAALSHATFIAFFALTHFVFLQAEVMRQRRQHRSTLLGAIRTLREEARDFRLISSSLAADPKARSRESDEERLAVGAVRDHPRHHLLHPRSAQEVARPAHLRPALARRGRRAPQDQGAGHRLRLRRRGPPSPPTPARSARSSRIASSSTCATPSAATCPTTPRPSTSAFLGVPVMEDGHLRGVLCADRGPRERHARSASAKRRSLQAPPSRCCAASSPSASSPPSSAPSTSTSASSRALARLNRALTADDVCADHLRGAREICEFDFAAITLFDKAPSATPSSAPSARRPRASPGCRSATTPASPRWWSRTSTSCPRAARSATRTRSSSPRRCASTAWSRCWCCRSSAATRRSARSPSPPSARAPSARTSARC